METQNAARVHILSPPARVQVLTLSQDEAGRSLQEDGAWLPCPLTPGDQRGHQQPWFKSLQRLRILRYRVLPYASWLLLYVCANAVAFALRFSCYPQDSVAWWWPAIAKGSAECILINVVLAILFICYHSVSKVRSLLGRCTSKRAFAAANPAVEKHVAFHQVAGVVVLGASVTHSIAWICIVVAIRTCSEANWNRSAYRHHEILRESPLSDLVLELPMWTGLLMLLCVIIAIPFCVPCARQRSYRVFLLIHSVFLPLTILLLVSSVLTRMLGLRGSFLYDFTDTQLAWRRQFHGAACWMGTLQAPYWLLLPTIVYARECEQRRKIPSSETRVVRYEIKRDTVILTLTKPASFGPRLQPGMVRCKRSIPLGLTSVDTDTLFVDEKFLFVQAPSISHIEWHPFSISSAPHDDFLQLHIQQVGFWTRELSLQLRLARSDLPVRVNGPIETSTGHFTRYEVVVFIAAGIGVTPFLSALRHILYLWRKETSLPVDERRGRAGPKQIYLLWTTRKAHHPEWVLQILDEFQDVFSHPQYQSALKIHVHLTCPEASVEQWLAHQRLGQFLHRQSQSCLDNVVTVHHERPQWCRFFSALGETHRSSRVERLGVFICANKRLTVLVKDEVAAYNATASRRANVPRLDVFAETF